MSDGGMDANNAWAPFEDDLLLSMGRERHDDHDLMCPLFAIPEADPGLCPYCPVIAKARADERKRLVEDTQSSFVDMIRSKTMREVADELVHTNRVVTLGGVIPWLRDWADHIDER